MGKHWKILEILENIGNLGKYWDIVERNHENSELWLVKLQKSQKTKHMGNLICTGIYLGTLGPMT